jgi:Zn finger protein HypA/HybF involved in hydrogenase expression
MNIEKIRLSNLTYSCRCTECNWKGRRTRSMLKYLKCPKCRTTPFMVVEIENDN